MEHLVLHNVDFFSHVKRFQSSNSLFVITISCINLSSIAWNHYLLKMQYNCVSDFVSLALDQSTERSSSL